MRALYVCDCDGSNLPALQAELGRDCPAVAVHARVFDAADEDAVRATCRHAVATHGRLDVFFANAGVVGSGLTPVADIPVDVFMATLRTNVVRCVGLAGRGEGRAG